MGIRHLFNKRLVKNVVLFLNFGAESSRHTNWPAASNLTNGVLLVAQGSTNSTHTIAVVPEIITLILLTDIYICFQIVCVCFSVSAVQHPNLRMIRWNATSQWIPLVKLDATGQMSRPKVFGLCLGIEAYPITKSIFKRHFVPDTFI